MRILHLVSNFRWTERVEPAADLAIAQGRLGHDVRYFCGRNRGAKPEDCIQGRAARKGLVYDDRLHLPKHFQPLRTWQDLPRLRAFLDEFQPEAIHCHLDNAHLLAALAVRGRPNRPVLVRTLYEPAGPDWHFRFRYACAPVTDGLVLVSEATRARLFGRFRREPDRAPVIIPGIDVAEFAGRTDLGRLEHVAIPPGAFVLGMVASINKRRRLDLALEAVAQLAPRYPGLRLMFVGRGKPDLFIHDPARRLGIADRVLVAGYCRNDDLVRAYHTMDALVYPFHGTDESCRTVREALAAGLPVVACALGIVPELIRDGRTGFLADFSGPGLAAALDKLLALNPSARTNMTANAAADARANFSRESQAAKTVAFYEHLFRRRSRP